MNSGSILQFMKLSEENEAFINGVIGGIASVVITLGTMVQIATYLALALIAILILHATLPPAFDAMSRFADGIPFDIGVLAGLAALLLKIRRDEMKRLKTLPPGTPAFWNEPLSVSLRRSPRR